MSERLDQTEESSAEELPKREVILEIGPGTLPIHNISAEVKQKIANGAAYIGAEINPEQIKTIRERHRGVGEYIVADSTHLPFTPGSVAEVWMFNVFSQFRSIPKRDGNRVIMENARLQTFQEIARVLKEGGSAYVGEYYLATMPIGGILTDDYGKLGFEARFYRGEQFKEFLKEHQIPDWIESFASSHDPFFLELIKKVKEK